MLGGNDQAGLSEEAGTMRKLILVAAVMAASWGLGTRSDAHPPIGVRVGVRTARVAGRVATRTARTAVVAPTRGAIAAHRYATHHIPPVLVGPPVVVGPAPLPLPAPYAPGYGGWPSPYGVGFPYGY